MIGSQHNIARAGKNCSAVGGSARDEVDVEFGTVVNKEIPSLVSEKFTWLPLWA